MNRKDYYFRQKVTDTELDSGFDYCEQADHAQHTDQELSGICFGFGCAQHTPVPDISVDVDGPGAGYDQLGQRIFFAALQNADVSQDYGGSSTAVAGAGNEKWVSLWIKFKRNPSDPRIDGYGSTVYFENYESWEFYVTQGAEAPAPGGASRPGMEADKLLLCDVYRYFGQTQVLNADLFFDRRSDVFQTEFFGRYLLDVHNGRLKDALDFATLVMDFHTSGILFNHEGPDVFTAAQAGVPYSLAGIDLQTQLGELLGFCNGIAGAYLPLAGGTMIGNILADADANLRALGGSGQRFLAYFRDVVNILAISSPNIVPLTVEQASGGGVTTPAASFGGDSSILGEAAGIDCYHMALAIRRDDWVRGSRFWPNQLNKEVPADYYEAKSLWERNCPFAWAHIDAAGVIVGSHFNIALANHLGPGHYIFSFDIPVPGGAPAHVCPVVTVRQDVFGAADWSVATNDVAFPGVAVEVMICNGGVLADPPEGFYVVCFGGL